MATIKQFHPGTAEPLSLSKSDEKSPVEKTPPSPRKRSKNAMAEIKKELYEIPKHLDVDNCKTNVNTNFADRTAMHIKSGLSEVIIDKPARKDSNTCSSPRLKNKAPAAI